MPPKNRSTPEYRAKEADRKARARAKQKAIEPAPSVNASVPVAVIKERARIAAQIDAASLATLQVALTSLLVEVAQGIPGAESRTKVFVLGIREARGIIEQLDLVGEIEELKAIFTAHGGEA